MSLQMITSSQPKYLSLLRIVNFTGSLSFGRVRTRDVIISINMALSIHLAVYVLNKALLVNY